MKLTVANTENRGEVGVGLDGRGNAASSALAPAPTAAAAKIEGPSAEFSMDAGAPDPSSEAGQDPRTAADGIRSADPPPGPAPGRTSAGGMATEPGAVSGQDTIDATECGLHSDPPTGPRHPAPGTDETDNTAGAPNRAQVHPAHRADDPAGTSGHPSTCPDPAPGTEDPGRTASGPGIASGEGHGPDMPSEPTAAAIDAAKKFLRGNDAHVIAAAPGTGPAREPDAATFPNGGSPVQNAGLSVQVPRRGRGRPRLGDAAAPAAGGAEAGQKKSHSHSKKRVVRPRRTSGGEGGVGTDIVTIRGREVQLKRYELIYDGLGGREMKPYHERREMVDENEPWPTVVVAGDEKKARDKIRDDTIRDGDDGGKLPEVGAGGPGGLVSGPGASAGEGEGDDSEDGGWDAST